VNVEPQPQPVDVRKPPIGAVLRLHPQGQRGLCGWCGKPVTDTTPVRGWLKFWHEECAAERAIIEQPAYARDAVFKRDLGVCVDCGEDWSDAYRLTGGRVVWHDPDQSTWFEEDPGLVWGVAYYQFQLLVSVSLWHVDHKVPLWKVRHLPPLQRIEYFKLANLITRCEHCHKIKSRKEAAERAHFNELAGENSPKRKSNFGNRQMPGGRNSPWKKRLNGRTEKRDGQSE
jgi:hypothetical protein